MATEQQLVAALRKADAAGNADDARKFAAEIRRMRGATPSAAPSGDIDGLLEPANIDLENRPQVRTSDGKTATVRSIGIGTDRGYVVIPTVSDDGRLLEPDEAIAQFRETGRHLGVFKDQKAGDLYAQRLHKSQEEYYRKPTRSRPEPPKDAFVSSVAGALPFGIGDYAGAAGKALANLTFGRPANFQQSLEEVRAERAAAAAENPAAAAAGTVVGLGMGGGAIAKGINAAAKAPVVGKAIEAATKLKQGQRVRNVLRVAGTGGAVGAAEAAARGEDAGTGAAVGALAAPAVSTVAHVAAPVVRNVAGRVSKSSEQGFRVLAKRLNVEPDDIAAFARKRLNDTGRAPSLAEIISARDAGELAVIAREHGAAGEVFQAAERRIAGNRAQTMRRQIERGGKAPTLAQAAESRRAADDAVMAPIRARSVPLSRDEAEFISNPEVVSVLGQRDPLRARLAELADGQRNSLTLEDFDRLRQALRKQQGALARSEPGRSQDIKELVQQITGIASDKSPEYARALTAFQRNAQKLTGTIRGHGGKSVDVETKVPAIRSLNSPSGRIGQRQGARRRLADEASSSDESAVRLANKLRQASALEGEAGVLKGSEKAALQRLGEGESTSAERLSQIAPSRLRTRSDEAASTTQRLLEGVAASAGKTLTGFKVHFIDRLVSQTHMSEGTARKLAEAATDPAKLPEVIAALKRVRINEDKALELIRDAAVAAGIGGAQVAE